MRKLIVLVVALAACGGGDDGGSTADANGGSGSATCTVTATATPNTANRTITGVGEIHCDAAANLALNVCVQWNPGGSFADIMCQMSSMSGMKDLQVQNISSCGIANGRRFRTRVSATVNGTAKPEMLSSEVGCE